MDETLVCWALLLFVFVWKWLGTFQCTQWCLHCLGPLTPLFQWYSVLFLGLGALLIRTLYNIAVYDYYRYSLLRRQALDTIPNITATHVEELRIDTHPVIRAASLLAPLAGLAAFLVVAAHVYENVKFGHQQRADKPLPWKPTRRQNLVLLVIAMPAVFIVMAIRSELRMWAVMTGSAWLPYSRLPETRVQWDEVERLEVATYATNLELACAFQYYTVWTFAFLCSSFLTQAPKDYKHALTWAGLQGVHLYVVVGVLRTAGDFAVAVLQEYPRMSAVADAIQEKALSKISTVFTVATLLCVYNMFLIAKVKDISSNIKNVSRKFLATRLLLLVSQIQLQLLLGMCVGSSLYTQLSKFVPLAAHLEHWHLSTYRAKLLHASLLGFECLVLSYVNRCSWPKDPQLFTVDEDCEECDHPKDGQSRHGHGHVHTAEAEGYHKLPA